MVRAVPLVASVWKITHSHFMGLKFVFKSRPAKTMGLDLFWQRTTRRKTSQEAIKVSHCLYGYLWRWPKQSNDPCWSTCKLWLFPNKYLILTACFQLCNRNTGYSGAWLLVFAEKGLELFSGLFHGVKCPLINCSTFWSDMDVKADCQTFPGKKQDSLQACFVNYRTSHARFYSLF